MKDVTETATVNEAGDTHRRARQLLIYGTAVAIILVLIVANWETILGWLDLLQNQELVSNQLQTYGWWGPAVLGLAHLLQVVVAFIPGHVFVIAGGYVYGFAAGFLLNYAFVVLASQLTYLVARWAGRPVVHRLADPEVVDHWEGVADRKGFTFFTISFLLPVLPSDTMNFVAGLSGILPRRFLAANMIGRLPSVVLLTLIGSNGLELSDAQWVAVGLLAVAVFVGGRFLAIRLQAPPEEGKEGVDSHEKATG